MPSGSTGGRNSVAISEADAYFAERYGADGWDDLTDSEKVAALATAELTLERRYSIDVTKTNHLYAICEQALFVVHHQEGIDQRWGLYQQGVKQSTVVGETYRDFPDGIPISMLAASLLDGSEQYPSAKLMTIDRDDDEIT